MKADKKDGKESKRPFVENTLPRIENKQTEAPQYTTLEVDFALARPLAAYLHRPNSKNWNPSISAPAVRGNYILVGADDQKSDESYLVCLDYEQITSRPVLDACPATEGSRYPTWLTDTRIAACSSVNGSLTVYAFDGERISQTDVFRGAHTREVRELAVCPFSRQHVASTGADGLLCVTDLSAGTLLTQTTLNGVGGSVKWTVDSIGVSLDNGRVMFYDVRTSLLKPQISYHPAHPRHLYTHERYSQYYTLLGYSNGDLRNVDLRTGKVIWQVEDHYVEGIGMIESRGNAFVTSGFSDFTVWKQDPTTREANIWSHSLDGVTNLHDELSLTFVATWFDHDTILATSSEGRVGIWGQDFGADQLAATQP